MVTVRLKHICTKSLATEIQNLCILSLSKPRTFCLRSPFRNERDGSESEGVMTLSAIIVMPHPAPLPPTQGLLGNRRRKE